MAQNIKIVFETDTTQLKEADAALAGLTAEEKALVEQARRVNVEYAKQAAAAKSTAKAITDLGDKIQKSNDPKQIERMTMQMQKLQGTVKKTGGIFSEATKLAAGFGIAFSVEAIIGGAINLGKQMVQVTAEFEKFRAVLTTTLGSGGAADAALQSITDFAASTPFSVQEITDSFVKLANSGLIPTEKELTRLGDLASSKGKSLDQLTEALIDAQVGEFERLKEFGVRAEQSGNQVKFTFNGISTTVNKTTADIQKYILGLGELKGVSGGMAAISKTLGGAISNLGDAFDQALIKTGGASSGILMSIIQGLTEFLGYIDRIGDAVSPAYNEIGRALSSVGDLLKTIGSLFGATTKEMSGAELVVNSLVIAFRVSSVAARLWVSMLMNAINGLRLLIETGKEVANFFGANLELDPNVNFGSFIKSIKDGQKGVVDAAKGIFAPIGAAAAKGLTDAFKAEIDNTLNLDVLNKKLEEARARNDKDAEGYIEFQIKRVQAAAQAQAAAAQKASEELIKAEKDAAKQLEKLRQENAVKSINDSKEAGAAKLAIDKSNALKEIEALKVTEATKAALRAEIERKFALQERDDIAKQQLEDDKNTLDARLQIIEDFADKQSEIVEYLALDGVKTNEEAANELVQIDIQTAERRLDALQMYADGIDKSTEDGIKAFKDAQKQIAAADKDLNAKRLKQAQDTQARLLELDKKRSEIQIQVGGIDAQVAEINKIGAAQLAQATAAEDRLAIELDTQEKIRAAYEETFEYSKGLIEQQLELDAKRFDVKGIKEGLAKSKTLYEEQAAAVAKTYDDQIAAAKKAGLDTTKLEQQRYDALKKLADNFKKFSADTWKDALNGISDYVQGFTDTAFQAINSLQQVLQAQADREVEAIERQKEAQEVQKNNANERISLYEKELETATGTRRKDLQNAINFERKKVREAERAQEDLIKKQEDIQRAAAKRQQAIDIAQAVINTAVAVTKTLATLGFPAGVPLAVAVGLAGAAQVAAIKAQRFADGTLAVKGGVEGRDSVPALLMPGEAVIPTKQARKYKPVLEQIMNDKLQIGNLRADFGAEFGAKSSGAALSLAETNARLDNLIQVVDKDRSKVFVTIDENGFNAGVRRGASVTHYLNKRFGANV